jgi:hypothetical protein
MFIIATVAARQERAVFIGSPGEIFLHGLQNLCCPQFWLVFALAAIGYRLEGRAVCVTNGGHVIAYLANFRIQGQCGSTSFQFQFPLSTRPRNLDFQPDLSPWVDCANLGGSGIPERPRTRQAIHKWNGFSSFAQCSLRVGTIRNAVLFSAQRAPGGVRLLNEERSRWRKMQKGRFGAGPGGTTPIIPE